MGRKRRFSRVNRRKSRKRSANVPTVIHRKYVVDIVKGTGSVDTGLYRNFTLATFPTSDVTSLFTDYRFKWIEIQYQLYSQPNNNSNFPTLYVAPQHLINTLTPPANRDEVLQFRGVKTFQFGPANMTTKYRYTPHIKTADGQIFRSPWISIANTTVAHMTNVEFLSKYNLATDNSHTLQINVLACIEGRLTR